MEIHKVAISSEFKAELADRIIRHTIQLTIMSEAVEYATGSSLLLSYAGHAFLLTSGHTFSEDKLRNVGINIDGDWIPLMLNCAHIRHASDDEDADDFAVCLLYESLAKKLLKTYKPIYLFSKDFKVVDHTPEIFGFIGYPASKTKFHRKYRHYQKTPYAMWMSSLSNKIEYYKGTNGVDLFRFTFNREKTRRSNTSLIQLFPELQGISGGGLFGIRPVYTFEYYLIGILNVYSHRKSQITGYHISNILPILDVLLQGKQNESAD